MPRWKQLLGQAQAAAKAARAIKAKADGESRALTDDERKDYEAKHAEAMKLKDESDKAKADDEAESFLTKLAGDDGPDDDPDDDPDGDPDDGTKRRKLKVRNFGDAFTKSEAYKSFQKSHPSGVSQGTPISIGRVKVGSMDEWFYQRKALTSPQAEVQPIRMPTVDQVDRDRLTFLDLISRGNTGGNFEYLQVIGVTRGADIVPEATSGTDALALKPTSEILTELADAKVYTYADGYDVTNQLLSDAPAFATYMNNELRYSLDSVVEDKLLNGTGTGGEPPGILTTTGVQQQTYVGAIAGAITDAEALAFVKGVRRAITKVTRLPGGTVTAIVLSPEMDEAIDLLQDDMGRFHGLGPFQSGPQTLWGRPRVTSERLVEKNALLGDFKQVALLDREGLSVLAFNQHKDYAQRNMTYVRAELRAAQVVWKPNRLCYVTPAGP